MNNSTLFNRLVKNKRLQRLSNSLVLIIPKTWIKSLNWNQYTQLTMAFHPDERKIIIVEKEKEENGKEISELISV